ncbi:MAG: hypothetical protein ABEJ07_01775 [Candidatus Nanohaloarchaea archaeon]
MSVKHQESRKEAEKLSSNEKYSKAADKFREAADHAESDEDKIYYFSKALYEEGVLAKNEGRAKLARRKLQNALDNFTYLEVTEEINKAEKALEEIQ